MLHVLLVLLVIGIVLYVVNAVVPMDGKVKTIFNALVILLLLVWLFKVVPPLLR